MSETNKVEVVISGMAGVFPESDNVEELKNLLFDKQNGITLDSRRWPIGEFYYYTKYNSIKNLELGNTFSVQYVKLL